MYLRLFITSLVLAIAIGVAMAHEFWMQPDKFHYALNEKLIVNLKVGEEFKGELWDLNRHRVERLELHGKLKMESIVDYIGKSTTGHIDYPLTETGTKLLVLQSNNAFSDLEGEKFNAYLQEDALDEALSYRRKTNTLDKNGTEFYQRNAKLLVQVGEEIDDTHTKVVGLPLEVMPEQHPKTLKIGSKMSFIILFQGKPLFGVKVRVWNRHQGRTTVQNIFTEQDGRVETHVSNKGAWMVSAIKMVPSKDPKADWQSYWGSLVFGIQ